MSADGYETRTVTALRTGSKIAVLCGLPLLGLAAYFYFTPLWVPKGDAGGVFGCGSAASPPDGWGKGACQGVNDAAKLRAIIALALGLLIPALGVALFGIDKRQERRPVRYDDDDEGYDDRPARRRTSASERADADDDVDRPRARASERRDRRSELDETSRTSSRESSGHDRDDDFDDDRAGRGRRQRRTEGRPGRRRSFEEDEVDRVDGRSTDI